MSSPMKLTSSASFSPSIRISLRLKIHQAQAKNFCRVLDIRVAQIVKANVPQNVLLQQLAEIGGNASGIEDIAHGIHKNIAVILFAVAISAYAPILLLLLPQRQQLFPDVADQRQGAQAGFRLGTVGADDFTFAVYLCVGYNVLNGDGVPLKVDGVPFQPQRLAAAQAVKGGHLNQQGVRIILGRFQQPLQLLLPVIVRNVPLLLGALHLVGGVEGKQVHFDGVFQRLVNVGMVMNHRGCADTFLLRQAEVLNVLCGQVLERHFLFVEVRCYDLLYGSRVYFRTEACPCINESILKQLFTEISDHVVKVDLVMKVCENRRTAGWYKRFSDYFDCLFFIGKMQSFYQEHGAGSHVVEPKKIWKLYTSDLYRMDAYYRHFHYAFGSSLKNANDVLEDSLKHSTEFVEALYQNWFLRELTACWTNAAADDLASLGYVSEIEKQHDFYKRYVVPASSKNTRAFVVILDALRYEVASELSERIVRNTKGTAELESMQAVFPSITKFGMAALLPGKSISVNDSMDVLVDGNPTRSTVERNAILNATPKASVAIQYNDLLNMKKDDRRELIAGKDVIYIYHNSIDAIGDKAPTESKVFDACETAIQELSGILRIIVNELSGTNIFITADHGFLYTYKPLNESDKIDRKAFSGNVYELGRRYALTASDTTADFLLSVNLERKLDGTPIKGYAPQDTIRMKVQGGGENYVHGGISLQELVVPVIAFKNLRTSNKNYVEVKNAELKLLSESRKISNLIFSLEFHQRQPVGDKIQPCTYSIYMTDDEGVVISDRQTVIADKSSDNAADRVFRVRFNLKAGTYDKKKAYRLVIASGIDMEEIEFHIDIAFADDFGFDL